MTDLSFMLSILSPYIGDYAADGCDSVPSEDFDPGHGCVPFVKDFQPAPLPPVKKLTTEEQRRWIYMSAAEDEARQDEYLKTHNI